MTDLELIQNIKKGEEESLGVLIERYGPYVSAVIARVSGNIFTTEDVEEMAADVFTAFWNSAGGFGGGREIKPWLARVARNTAFGRMRQRSVRESSQALSLDDDIMILEKDTTDELAVKREQQSILNEAVRNLKEPDREIFTRFYFFNEKVDAIGEQLGVNPATVKTKLRRSRERLREAFEERGYTYYEG